MKKKSPLRVRIDEKHFFARTLVIIALCCSTLAGGLAVIKAAGIGIEACEFVSGLDASGGLTVSSVLSTVVVAGVGLVYAAD